MTTIECDGYDCQNTAFINEIRKIAELNAIGWTRHGNDMLCARCAAELARREAQAGPSPAAVGSHAAFNDALMVEAAQKIDELRAENARLRALLALCVATMEAVSDDDRLELTHLDDPHYSRHTVSIGTLRDVRDRLNTAIAAAKEAIR